MDKDTFKILDFLSNHVYGSIVDIRDLVNKMFPYRKGMTTEQFEDEKKLIIRFFEGMEKPIYMVNFNGSRNISGYDKDKDIWFEEGKLNAVLITSDGLQAVSQAKFNKTIKSNSSRQTLILAGTLLISLISLGISWLNYAANTKYAQRQYLLLSKELIEQLIQKETITKPEKPTRTIQMGRLSKGGKVSNSKPVPPK